MPDIIALIREIPDYPKPGILFYDITPVLADAAAFSALMDSLAEPFERGGIDKVAGIEARGFMLAAGVAERLGAGFIPIRKAGKLPYRTQRQDYDLEYGSDAVEIHEDAVGPGDRVLIVDDVIATGGTAVASARLLERVGAELAGLSVFIELTDLGGRATLDGLPFHAIVQR
ncbi:MAG: adenine phosphoribosyltransferase [Acidimicrobiia bacterium]